MPAGYVTEMGMQTHIKGRCTFHRRITLVFWGDIWVQKRYIVQPSQQRLILDLPKVTSDVAAE